MHWYLLQHFTRSYKNKAFQLKDVQLFNNAPQGVAFFRSIELRDASCVFNSKKNTFCVNGFDLHRKIVADSVMDRRFYKIASKEAGSKL